MFWRRPLGILLLAVGVLAAPRAAPAAHADGCRFVLGFATLHALIPQIVGRCVDDEAHNPANGDGLQHTAGGLLVWRKADNWTAFTDGYHTWVNGPNGLEYRLNDQRFAWEANPGGLPVVPDVYGAGPLSQSQGARPSGAKLRVTNSPFGGDRGPLVFDVAGSGFAPGETVTVRGTYTPAFVVDGTERRCDPVTLGPVQVTADGAGDFSATLTGDTNLLKGGPNSITATGSAGSSASLGSAGSLPQVSQLPAGCRA